MTGATFANIQAVVLGASGVTATFDAAQVNGAAWSVAGVAGGAVETFRVNMTTTNVVSLASLTAVTDASIVLVGTGANDSQAGSLAADSILGGGGDDFIYGNGGADTIHGGAGADTAQGDAGADIFLFAAGDTGVTAGSIDEVLDFTAGTDFLSTGVAGSLSNYAESLADAGTYASAAGVADGLADGTLRYIFVVVGPDGYLFIDRDLDGTVDEAIKLTGVTDLSFGNIIA